MTDPYIISATTAHRERSRFDIVRCFSDAIHYPEALVFPSHPSLDRLFFPAGATFHNFWPENLVVALDARDLAPDLAPDTVILARITLPHSGAKSNHYDGTLGVGRSIAPETLESEPQETLLSPCHHSQKNL